MEIKLIGKKAAGELDEEYVLLLIKQQGFLMI